MKKLVLVLFLIQICFTTATGQTSVLFEVQNVPLNGDQKVGIRGNATPLSWEKSILLENNDGVYSTSIIFENDVSDLEFKFVMFSNEKEVNWESIQNRKLNLEEYNGVSSTHSWNKAQIIDITTLKPIPSELLLKDYALIEKMVLDVHPGTYRYNTKEEIHRALDELKSSFNQSLTYQEAYLAISKLTAKLKCDHTKAGFNNQSEIINAIIHEQKDKVPFAFRWIDDEMIVTHNASNNKSLVKGTKILSINQVPALDIRNSIIPFIGADGATDANRIYKAEVYAYDFRYYAFDIFYPLLYKLGSEFIQLKIQQADSDKIEQIVIQLMTRDERFSILTKRYESFPATRDEMWSFEITEDRIGILTLNSFGLYGWKAMTLDYKAFLADAFKKIEEANIENLIIDIRENNGGNDEMSIELFKYLAKANKTFPREGRTRYLTFPESLKPHIKSWGDENPWYYNLNPKDKNPVNGYYVFKENFKQKNKLSNKSIYSGKTYLMIGSANTSLAFYTAARFKMQNLGTTIGTETGGNLNDINGGQILFLNLPHSKIEIDFPVMGAFTTPPQSDQGIKPDIEVHINWKDLRDKRDLAMEKLLDIIRD